MAPELVDLCRQLRLAHIAEYISSQQDEQLRGLAEQLLAAELDGRRRAWMERKENLLLMGAVGTGKTHMAIALGVDACRRGKAVQFYRASDLVAVLQEKFVAGTLSKFRDRLRKMDLLILDEVGYVPFSQTGSELLLRHLIFHCSPIRAVMFS